MWEPPPPAAHSPDHSRHRHDEFQLCKSAFRLGELSCSDGKTKRHVNLLHAIESAKKPVLSDSWFVSRLDEDACSSPRRRLGLRRGRAAVLLGQRIGWKDSTGRSPPQPQPQPPLPHCDDQQRTPPSTNRPEGEHVAAQLIRRHAGFA